MSPLLGVGEDVARLGQRLRRISFHARLSERHQHLALRAELDDDAALLVFARKFLQLLGGRHARVGDPDIAVAIDMDAVRPDEHAAAEAFDLLARLVEMMNRIGLGAETSRRRSGRAAVGRPHGLAVLVDGDAVGAAPRPLLQRELGPIADHAIGIGAAVDRRNVARLRRARRLRLHGANGHRCEKCET